MPNILVTTFGTSWAILPEIISFCNYPEIKIFSRNVEIEKFKKILSSKGIDKIDELWAICTNSQIAKKEIEKVKRWNELLNLKNPIIKYISLKGIDDLRSQEDCQKMSDLIFRTILHAQEYKKNGKLIVSLTGGRKTMSSDIQRAAEIFGCDMLFHIANKSQVSFNEVEDLIEELDEANANGIFPLEVKEIFGKHFVSEIPYPLSTEKYSLNLSFKNEVSNEELFFENEASTNLAEEISNRLSQANYLLYNSLKIWKEKNSQSIFYGLLQLSPSQFSKLQNEKPEYDWIKSLPKVDLHIHLGGALDASGMITTALSNIEKIKKYERENESFSRWINRIREAVQNRDDSFLLSRIEDIKLKKLHNQFDCDEFYLAPVAFLTCFENSIEYFERLLYSDFEKNSFENIGFEAYESLGNFQGSSLLQTKESLQTACKLFIKYCHEQNISYIELRCSPCNYTKFKLTEKDVIKILYDNLHNDPKTKIRLIIIGSRHGDMAVFKKHIELTLDCKNDSKYKDFIVGFDVAGNEEKKKPAELRPYLLQLLKECVKITIHAGENQPVDNIWEAAYELNADRIGHGLTLIENETLMKRFKDRNIFIEMCPSSNFQIGNFNSNNGGAIYPLRKYFDSGLKVTINTDNPGISRTNITKEYLFASEIANLSKLDIIKLIRNSFQGVFVSKDEKKQLLIDAETKIFEILSKEQ